MNENKRGLTDKQKKFCIEYIIDWNATQAAIRAGYSPKSSQQISNEILLKPVIKEYIKKIQKDLEKAAHVSALKNIKRLDRIADSSEEDNNRIRAMEVINKMLGYNEPNRINLINEKVRIGFSNGVK